MGTIIRSPCKKAADYPKNSLSLIKEMWYQILQWTGQTKSTSTNFPYRILIPSDDDILGYVADGVTDLGIVGENKWS